MDEELERILTVDNEEDVKILSTKSVGINFGLFSGREMLPKLIKDMHAIVKARKDCAGLAANQIGINANVFCVKRGGSIRTFINPKITARFGGSFLNVEGCLSRPNKEGLVATRYRKVTLNWYDKKGNKKTGNFKEFEAIVIQHEMDHLAGVLI